MLRGLFWDRGKGQELNPEDLYASALEDLAREESESGEAWFGPEAWQMATRYGIGVLKGHPLDTLTFVEERLAKASAISKSI